MSNSLDLDALDQRTLPTFNPERLEFTVAEGRFLGPGVLAGLALGCFVVGLFVHLFEVRLRSWNEQR